MKKKRLVGIILISAILIIVLVVAISNYSFKIELKGEKSIEVGVNSIYEDDGYIIYRFGKETTEQAQTFNNVDTAKIGEYEVKYSFKNRTVIRKVSVKDYTAPELTLNGDSRVSIRVGDKYNDLGAKAQDNYDGDITNKIVTENNVDTSKEGSYEIIYTVSDSSGNEAKLIRNVVVEEKYTGGYVGIVEGPTYIKGILIVNKKYSLPSSYGGTDSTAMNALQELQKAAREAGFSASLVSGYRSYQTQASIYNSYVQRWGQEYTDTVSARPGHSEHQTGLAFDVGELTSSYGETKEGIWLRNNCQKYGFIIRYPKGKENITGYAYEPWHIRYVGVDVATYIMEHDLTLEEYLGV